MSPSTQIKLEPKGCIFHIPYSMYSECTLIWFMRSRTPLWGGRHRRLPVTDAHLQHKKYEFNNPKVSSPDMWLASKLDSGTMTEATSWLLRILWVLIYAGIRSADQKCIPYGLMRRINMYRDEVERVSGWETSSMRVATETTTKGGRGRAVLWQRRQRQKKRWGRTRRCRQQPRQPTTTTSSPPDGFKLGTNVGKKLKSIWGGRSCSCRLTSTL